MVENLVLLILSLIGLIGLDGSKLPRLSASLEAINCIASFTALSVLTK